MIDRHDHISGELLSYLDFIFMQIIALGRIEKHIS